MNLQLHCPAKKTSELCEDDTVCDDFNIDEMDLFLKDEMDIFSKDEMDLELENYEELFGMALCHSEELFENGGIGSLFEAKDISASAGDSNCQGALTAEVLKFHHPLLVISLVFLFPKHCVCYIPFN